MNHIFYPNPAYLSSPMIDSNKFEISRKIVSVPVIRWLIENVGEMAEFKDKPKDNEWPHGNGWEMGHNYWENRHYIIIRRKDLDEKLLTEFALRFL